MNKENESVSKSLKREELVKYAYGLFYKNGFHATGVDTITQGAGISKRTLYKYFASKEDLIIATIEYYHQIRGKAIAEFLERSGSKDPIGKALAIFDFLEELVDDGLRDGCFAMNAKSEYTNKATGIEAAYNDYVAVLLALIEQGLNEAHVKNSKSLTMQVAMLFEGAIVRSRAVGNSLPVRLAKEAAQIICNYQQIVL